MDIGIAFNLKSDFKVSADAPEDRLAEYDNPVTVEGIADALRKMGHTPRMLGGGRRFLEGLLREPPELVFNIAEGWGGRSREAQVPAVCEMLGIPFTHSDALTQAVTLDKSVAKDIIRSHGVPTAPSVLVRTDAEADSLSIELPAIAKPAYEGSSMGLRKTSRSTGLAALRENVRHLLHAYNQPVLVEGFLSGREVTVTLLGDEQPEVLGIMEIAPTKMATEEFVYSREFKVDWVDDVAYFCPARLTDAERVRVEQLAVIAYKALGCRDLARIDFRFDAHGEPNFLEANALPGIQPGYSDTCILAEKCGMDYTQLIGRILASAAKRYGLKA